MEYIRRSTNFFITLSIILVFTIIPINASTGVEIIDNIESVTIQPRFTNITVFLNDFYIDDQGKAYLTSTVDARNVDEIKISMYLQKYQDGNWTTVKHWSTTQKGTFCGIGESWYVLSGYQYRMISYAYVYNDDTLLESTYYVSGSQIY